MMTATTPRVWIGCLACYNAGNLNGRWFDAINCPTDEIDWRPEDPQGPMWAEHITQGHEELWVMDHDGFEGLLTGECSPAEAQRLAELLESVPEDDRPALVTYMSAGYLADNFEDAFCGEWSSLEVYADDLLTSTGMWDEIPEWAQPYFDLDKYARELEMGDYWTAPAPNGWVYVFRSI